MSHRRELGHATDDTLDALLRVADASIPVPAGLAPRIADRIEQRRRRVLRQRRIGFGLAAAALVAISVIGWLLAPGGGSSGDGPPPRHVAASGADASAAPQAAGGPAVAATIPSPRPARVDFDRGSALFAREIPSSDPRVTIHFVYRAVAPPASSTPAAGDGDSRSQS